jgi:uncharacterized protein YaaQ
MTMKLVVAIVQNEDADELIEGLTAAHYGATRLASTGGFLRQGNTTIIVGVPDEAVQNVVNIIAQHSHSRRQPVTNPFPDNSYATPKRGGNNNNQIDPLMGQILSGGASPEVQTGRATVFVLNLDRYERV